jgi:superkiller protein 3
LSGQFNNARRVEVFEGQMKELRQRMDVAAAMINAREIYRDALNRAPDDYMLHENFAQFLECIGDVKEAAAEWIRAHELSPRNPFAFCQAGRLLAQQNQWAEAQAALSQAVVLHPRYLEAWLELGSVPAEGKIELAMEKPDRARRPSQTPASTLKGQGIFTLHRSEITAPPALRPAGHWEAHYALGGELALHDKILEAKSEFENAIRLQPDYAPAHFNLGVALMKLRQLDEASRQFEETLRLEPTDRFALDYLKQTRAAPGNREP